EGPLADVRRPAPLLREADRRRDVRGEVLLHGPVLRGSAHDLPDQEDRAMTRRTLLAFGTAALLATGCEQLTPLDRKLTSFDLTLLSPVRPPEKRRLLAATPTTGVDLSGCPDYVKDASGTTVIRVNFMAKAIDNRGKLMEDFEGLATVKVVPGDVDSAF